MVWCLIRPLTTVSPCRLQTYSSLTLFPVLCLTHSHSASSTIGVDHMCVRINLTGWLYVALCATHCMLKKPNVLNLGTSLLLFYEGTHQKCKLQKPDISHSVLILKEKVAAVRSFGRIGHFCFWNRTLGFFSKLFLTLCRHTKCGLPLSAGYPKHQLSSSLLGSGTTT